MKKELYDKLLKYSGAATAVLATGFSANGQIVYNQVNKTIAPSGGQPLAMDSIDINADGNFDLAMQVVTYSFYGYGVGVVYGGPINSQGHAMAGGTFSTTSYSYTYNYNYPFKLNAGNSVKNQQFVTSNSPGYFAVDVNGSSPIALPWNGGVTNGYVGMKLQFGANTHYGWIRMDISAGADQVVIKDMAYESTPDKDIAAGTNGLNLDKYREISNSVWTNDKQLNTNIKIGFTSGSVQLLDMTGKQVKSFELRDSKESFDLSDLPTGTYVLSLNLDGNIFNKQAVIH